jgi:hypothetical protein
MMAAIASILASPAELGASNDRQMIAFGQPEAMR